MSSKGSSLICWIKGTIILLVHHHGVARCLDYQITTSIPSLSPWRRWRRRRLSILFLCSHQFLFLIPFTSPSRARQRPQTARATAAARCPAARCPAAQVVFFLGASAGDDHDDKKTHHSTRYARPFSSFPLPSLSAVQNWAPEFRGCLHPRIYDVVYSSNGSSHPNTTNFWIDSPHHWNQTHT